MRETEDAERQRRIQERAREKKEMEDARAKIKAELEKDKRERLAARGVSAGGTVTNGSQDATSSAPEGAAGTPSKPAAIAEKVIDLDLECLPDGRRALLSASIPLPQLNRDDGTPLWQVRESLRDAKRGMSTAAGQQSTDDQWRSCLMTLGKILTNATKDDPKYWKVGALKKKNSMSSLVAYFRGEDD